jgi:peptidyl-prolyl cis-trans isomerase C
LALFLLVAFQARAEEKPDTTGKVAVVNGKVITQEEFDREMIPVQQRLSSQGGVLNEAQLADVRQKVLENTINLELIYQESQKAGITVDDAAVDEQVAKLKARFPSETEYGQWLGRMKITEDIVKAQLKRGMSIQKFIESKFDAKTAVSDSESKAYYDEHPELFKKPEQIKASHILVKVDSKADETQKAAARKNIEAIQEKLAQGADFAETAKASSEGPSKDQGGDLGYFGRGQMVKPFEDAAFALEPGKVSDVVETPFGYHLIKVHDKKPETVVNYDDVKERLTNFLKNQKVQTEMTQYVNELKETAKIERFLVPPAAPAAAPPAAAPGAPPAKQGSVTK